MIHAIGAFFSRRRQKRQQRVNDLVDTLIGNEPATDYGTIVVDYDFAALSAKQLELWNAEIYKHAREGIIFYGTRRK